jgi:glycosyltransferase involved in cell wall biosynthesis
MNIHIISSSLRMNSGFSIVAKNLAIGLRKLGYNITYSALQTAYLSEYGYGIEQLPTQVGFVDDVTQCMVTINRIKPDIVLAIIQMDADFNDFAKIFPKTVIYSPVEGRNIPQRMANDLMGIKMNGGIPVAQCKYGQGEMQLALAGIDIPYIYHGFDDKIFKPIDLNKKDEMTYCYYKTESGKANSDPIMLHKFCCYDCQLNNKEQTTCPHYREEYIGVLKFINGKWTEENIPITNLPMVTKGKYEFLFVGQNLGVRKRIERLLKAYSIFIGQSKQLKDRTVIHLHTMPISINGTNLISIIQNLGIQDSVIFSYGSYRSSGWTDQAMNILYNTADVNISASSSEGFGLAIIESMACGIPNIGPNCSSFTELIGDGEKDPNARGFLASIGEWQMIENGSERALVNEQHLSLMMKKLYSDEKLREKFSKNAIKFSKDYTWDKICLQWDELLRGMK